MASQRRILLVLALSMGGGTVLFAQQVPDTLGIVIKRVNPATVDRLPRWLRDALAKGGCLIPQMHSDDHVNNIHQGYLVDSVTESYALLCSRGGQSSVLVVTRDSALTPPPILLRPDTSYLVLLQREGGFYRREFGRYLSLLTPSEVQRWCPLPAAEKGRVHSGIITFHQDRDATAYYFAQANREWIRCTVPVPD